MKNEPAVLAPKIGDRVVCIDDECSFHRLAIGATYTVTAAFDGSPTVEVGGAYHCLDRFEVAK